MSDCSQHKKDLFGKTDMKEVAEAIGDLHYQTLMILFFQLSIKINHDQRNDWLQGREKLASELKAACKSILNAGEHFENAWQISKPFMNPTAQ